MNPARQPRALSQLRSTANVGRRERIGSALIGGALAAAGLRSRGPMAAALLFGGSALVARGAGGRCPVYASMGIDRAHMHGPVKQRGPNAVLDASESVRVEHSVTVARSADDLWDYWRELENLPQIMRHILEVRDLGDGESSWVARGPAGTRIRWRARIINEVPGEMLAWKSLEGADIPNAGSVHFTPVRDGTRVRVLFEYDPPAGRIGATIAALFRGDPDLQVREDMVRFRRAMESESHGAMPDREVDLVAGRETLPESDEGGKDRMVPRAPELETHQGNGSPADDA
ncbi:MAG TPA: SRPBCC family protein [Gemmatimonadales bacterium]|nr:SRPBCC family protein [Gemmatimonadales bacterium]